MYWDYDDYDNSSKRKMDSKARHPFAITCRKCGGNDIKVIAYEHYDLGISCRSCGFSINCGAYYTMENDYSGC